MRRDRLEIITQFSSQTTSRSPEEAALCHMTLFVFGCFLSFMQVTQVKYGNQDQHVDCLSSHQLSAVRLKAPRPCCLLLVIDERAPLCRETKRAEEFLGYRMPRAFVIVALLVLSQGGNTALSH